MQHRLETAGVRSLRRRGEGLSFANLREYAIGDDPRRIDWKATARRARLITREYAIERSQTVIVLIDAGRNMTQLAATHSRFEQALSSALVLTDIAANAGDRVGALVFDDEIRAYVPARPGRSALQAIRDAFVPLTATTREPDYAAAFRFLAAHQRKRALIVFITDVIDPRASQALIAHVSRSAARHLAVVVALRNDAIFAAALPRAVGGPDRLYESAAAEELILAREEALQRMRRAGVSVIDVSPQAMTASVINRYLETQVARSAVVAVARVAPEPPRMYAYRRIAVSAETESFHSIGHHGIGETIPSSVPATSSRRAAPQTSLIARLPFSTSARRRVRAPGIRSAAARRKPAPPEMQIAVSSSTPCGATNASRSEAIPFDP